LIILKKIIIGVLSININIEEKLLYAHDYLDSKI